MTDESGEHRSARPSEAAAPAPGEAAFIVRHLTGSRRGSEERFAGGHVGIGRGRTNRIALDAELDRTVSARHAEIRAEGSALVLYDLGSLNGTYVNGRRVRRSELADGDEIGLGREGPRLTVHRVGGAAAMQTGAEVARPAPAAARKRPDSDPPALRKTPRSRPARIAIAGGILLLVTALIAVFFELRGRIDRLERGPEALGTGEPAVRRPATAVLSVVGVFDEGGGRSRSVALGAAVHVRRRTAATTDVVAEAAARFLAGRPDGRIEVHSDGDPPSTVVVTGRRGVRADSAPASVVLLELVHDMGAPSAGLGAGPPPRKLVLRRAFFPDESAALEEAVDEDGRRAAVASRAPFLRAAFGAGEAGSGVFDEDGALRGLLAGPGRPGLVVSAALIESACDLLETTPASPLR